MIESKLHFFSLSEYDFYINKLSYRLRLLRKVSGSSVDELSKILYITPAEYLTFECGHNVLDITVAQLLDLSFYYKVSIDYIIGTSYKADRPRPKRHLVRTAFKEDYDIYYATLMKKEKETAD